MKQKQILIIGFLIISTAIITSSCLKKQAEKLSPTTTNNTNTVGYCDTIKYAKHIAPIVSLCGSSGCHNAAPRVLLTNYTQVKNAIDGGQITINTANKHIMGNGKDMSATAGTTTEQDNWFKCWKDNGTLNN
jgi:hypothetical protein